ncbi:uncharacterized protein MYCFIDRAFT_80730 [Pseudocercospora fijiensis CIRAD86]|uniref:Uncharacterized protein n=1 Tax=Pseudocercospora fijiensis (strain CIRAD86) TaxID=383855 RepID=M2YKQ6_PSEFD|nr:uncharacterized protein MYCFIDRAFT_80730 [Pseudocercospora fijiensis CIRAD86]EME78305.1 hypothetical protein MYCFIDRAFT_80730 [Pseudocercospora fijiensis CIRAD86]
MDDTLAPADTMDDIDWSTWVNNEWTFVEEDQQRLDNTQGDSEHRIPQNGDAVQSQDQQQPSWYTFDTSLDDARPSTEQHTPSPLEPRPTTIAPQVLSRHEQPHEHGFSDNALPDTAHNQWLPSGGYEEHPNWFPDQIPNGYRQHTPSFSHQQSIYEDSRSGQAPYFTSSVESDLADRSRHASSDLGSAHHNPDISNHTASNGGINLLNSPAVFPGAQPSNSRLGYYPPTQMPERNMYLAYENQQNSPMNTSASPDIPDPRGSQSAFSPEPTFSPDPQPSRKKGRGHLVPSPIVYKDSIPCVACTKPFKKSIQPDRCNRCAEKFLRHNATPVTFTLDPEIPNQELAKQLICKSILARGPPIAPLELENIRENEDEYIQRFLTAINTFVPGGIGHHNQPHLTWPQRQQIIYNQKSTLEESYSSAHITARLRALFAETLAFHTGTSNPFYGTSGDSSGYSENTRLSFEERVEKICGMLRTNKRVVMDVVEGRGVKGFVGHPENFEKRKVANNDCNLVKKRIMEQGKEKGEGQGKKRKRGKGKGKVVEEDEMDVDVEAGPSNFEGHSGGVEGSGGVEDQAESSHAVEYGSGRSRTMDWLRGGRATQQID